MRKEDQDEFEREIVQMRDACLLLLGSSEFQSIPDVEQRFIINTIDFLQAYLSDKEKQSH